MKKYIIHDIFAFLGAWISLFIVGCTSGTQWNDLEFYNVEKLEQLKEAPLKTDEEDDDAFAQLHKKESREMDVKVDMQFLKSGNQANEQVCKLINDQLVEMLLNQSSEMTVDEAVAQYIEDVKKEFHGDEVANIYYDHLTGRAEYGYENIINYRLVEDVFMGGAHPCTITTILRFNAMTGEFIPLEGLFTYPQQKQLQELLLERLMKMNQARSLEDLHKKGILEMSDMFISKNFALRADSLEFYYNEYDIAPYAYGSFSICLSYEDVKDLMPSLQKKQ